MFRQGLGELRFQCVVWILLVVSLTFAGCGGVIKQDSGDGSFDLALVSSEIDNRAVMDFKPDKPFHLEFGRGSGWHGLEVVKLNEKGLLETYEFSPDYRRGVCLLEPDVIREVAGWLVENNVFEMNKAYSAGVNDGSQWIIWIKQNGVEKSVYFDNYFPKAIQNFATSLDAKMKTFKMEYADWVGPREGSDYQKAIWASIRSDVGASVEP